MNRLLMEALSLESADAEKTSGYSEETLLAAQLSVESAALDIQESAHTLEMIGYQLSELEHAHATLESMGASLEALLEKDERGLDRVAAEGYTIAAKAVLGDAMAMPIASLESFGGETESSHATQISLEGIVSGAKKLWETIKRVVVNAIRAVRDFFSKIFQGVDGLNKNINAVLAKIAAAEKSGAVPTTKDKKFKVARGSDVAWKDSVYATSVLNGISVVNKEVVDTSESAIVAAAEYYRDVIKGFKASKTEDIKKAAAAAKKAGKEFGATDEGTNIDLPGGYVIKNTAKLDSEAYLVNFTSTIKRDGDQLKDVETVVWSLADTKKIVEATKRMVSVVEKKKSTVESITKLRDELVKTVDKWSADAEAGRLKEALTAAQSKMVMRSAQSDVLSANAKMLGYLFSYVRAILAAANSAVDAYGEKKAEGSTESTDDVSDDVASTESDDDKKDDDKKDDDKKDDE